MEFATLKHFRDSMKNNIELSEYTVAAYVKCINDMIRLMTDGGIEAVVSVLMEVKHSYGPLTSSSQTTQIELPEANPTVGDDQEVGY